MYENSIEQILNAQNGDRQELQNLIDQNNGLIWSIVKRFLGRGYASEDLYQIACIGFIKSIKRFDATFEVKLSTYAVPYILGEIKRFLRDDGIIKVSRSTKELKAKINEMQKISQITQGRNLTLNELSEKLGIEKEEVALALQLDNQVESLDGSDQSSGEGKTINILDKLSSNKNEQDIITNKIAIKDAIKKLNDKEKQIIMLRYYKGMTQNEVSKIIGVTQVQVSRLEKKILEKMKHNLIA